MPTFSLFRATQFQTFFKPICINEQGENDEQDDEIGGIHILRRQLGGREGVAKCLHLSTRREGGIFQMST